MDTSFRQARQHRYYEETVQKTMAAQLKMFSLQTKLSAHYIQYCIPIQLQHTIFHFITFHDKHYFNNSHRLLFILITYIPYTKLQCKIFHYKIDKIAFYIALLVFSSFIYINIPLSYIRVTNPKPRTIFIYILFLLAPVVIYVIAMLILYKLQ